MARRRRRNPRPGGRPRGKKRRRPPKAQPIVHVVPDSDTAKLEEDARAEIAALMKSLMSEGGLVEEERLLARIVEQHPEYAEAFMGAEDHDSHGDPDSPFFHVGLHLRVERGVVSRQQDMTREASDKSWHDAVHAQAEVFAASLAPAEVAETA